MEHRVIIITGVSGSGKTSVGETLGRHLGLPFYDGDDFHPQANKEKMGAGIPLDDMDRKPWLNRMNAFIKEQLLLGSLVVACSALKERYRQWLVAGIPAAQVKWFHLTGSYDLIHARMEERKGHYMGAAMLRSQFDAYESPSGGNMISIEGNLAAVTGRILRSLVERGPSVGLIGLGVMGTSLARNIAGRQIPIALYNRRLEGKEEDVAMKAVKAYSELETAWAFEDIGSFVEALVPPRQVILMVNAGKPVDLVIDALLPFLQPGDVVMDGGNSHFSDTDRRQQLLHGKGIHFVGAGISGGEEGARLGPAIMPGGSKEGYDIIKPLLEAIAAQNTRGEVCCRYIGNGGAGHFVKMVHNGIEYAEMALIAEIYAYLSQDAGYPAEEIARLFEQWNRGDTASYLLEITVDILRFKDDDGVLLLDKILDRAGNKGTGSWTTIAAAELGVAVPSLTAALFARYISTQYEVRQQYAKIYDEPRHGDRPDTQVLQRTYQFCRLMHHHQGFALIQAASDAYGWDIDLRSLLTIWSGGCIIRSALLGLLQEDWEACGGDLLRHAYTRILAARYGDEYRTQTAQLAAGRTAMPVTMAGFTYFMQWIEGRSNAHMIQAQRDYFGAHGFVEKDDPLQQPRHAAWKKG